MKERNMSSAELISAFEGSILDIEVLAQHRLTSKTDPSVGVNGCILGTFTYRTRPEMKVVQEGYQRGPVHVGRFEMNLRSYVWSDEEVENYKKFKEKEMMMLMGDVSDSVKHAMEALGEELDIYLAEARVATEQKTSGNTPEKKQKSMFSNFFGTFYTPKEKGAKAKKPMSDGEKKSLGKAAGGHANFYAFNTFKNFKKSHRMIAW